MKKLALNRLIAAIVLATPLAALADGPATPPTRAAKINVAARGHDVRQVLTDIFQQAKKSCVIQRTIHSELYLTLENTPFDQALDVVCKQSGLAWDLTDGVYYIHTKPIEPKVPALVVVKPAPAPAAPVGKLPIGVLTHRVNTRLHKAPIRTVLDTFAEQAGVKIELDPHIPAYKLDAFLLNTSLKYALDEVTHAANLAYKFTDHQTILITNPESKVTLIQ